MPPEPGQELLLRPSTVEDAPALAELFLRAREAAYPAMPRPVHPPESVRAWVRGWYDVPEGVTPEHEPWVAVLPGEDDRIAGYLLLEHEWLHSLYVEPGLTGHGIGSALLDLAKGLRPDGLGLWVFETNDGARRFYARHGFAELRRTDGSDNEEGEPDVEMRWAPGGAVADLRRRVDEVDERLARLLAVRAELTAAIQGLKDVPGEAGRDPSREREIARRMAGFAPVLGEDRLARIMDVVISESLDAVTGRE